MRLYRKLFARAGKNCKDAVNAARKFASSKGQGKVNRALRKEEEKAANTLYDVVHDRISGSYKIKVDDMATKKKISESRKAARSRRGHFGEGTNQLINERAYYDSLPGYTDNPIASKRRGLTSDQQRKRDHGNNRFNNKKDLILLYRLSK